MWRTLRKQGSFIRSLSLVVFEALLLAVATPFLLIYGTAWSVAAAGVAGGLCLAGAILSLWIAYTLREPRFALTGLLLGMAANMFIPLAFGVMIHISGGTLSQSGFIYYLIFFYLATLAAKTMLILPPATQSNG
jgi:hypothetical protein